MRPNTIYLFFYLCFSLGGFRAQQEYNRSTESGLRQGKWILYWRDMDTLNRCGSGKNCPVDAIPQAWHNPGYRPDSKYMECTYVNGVIEGLVTKYHPNGKVMVKRFYVNGKTDGIYESFYENGNLKESGMMKNRVQAGVASQYYETGSLKERVIFTDEGKLNGHWVKYYYNGTVKSILMYYSGKRNGYGLTFDSTGNLTQKFYYIDGEKVGEDKEKKNELEIMLSFVNAENAPVFNKKKLIEAELARSKESAAKEKALLEIQNQKVQKQLDEQLLKAQFEKSREEARIEQAKKDAVVEEEKKVQRLVIVAVSIGLGAALLLSGFIFRSYNEKKKANALISRQKMEVEEQKRLVEIRNTEILDSMRYAKRIQSSLMPNENFLEKVINKLKK